MNPFLRRSALRVEAFLDGVLPPVEEAGTLARVLRYAVFAGGKRFRPALAIASAMAVGGRGGNALPAAGALELLHTYSLIHDDLPCMDDDELRRGQPTVHVRFGEAMAVLAGDALHTLAFAVLAGAPTRRRITLESVRRLARAAGPEGMVGGQVLDLEAETRLPDVAGLEAIHRRKTGALLAASAALGALAGGAGSAETATLERFGRELGLVFQIVDDLLDEEGTTAALGKSAGKDRAAGKATYPLLHGAAAARNEAARRTAAAIRLLDDLEPDPASGNALGQAARGKSLLRALAVRVLNRRA